MWEEERGKREENPLGTRVARHEMFQFWNLATKPFTVNVKEVWVMTKNIGIPWCQRCSWANSVFEIPEHFEPVSPCQTKHSIVLLVQRIPWSRTAIIQVLLRSLLEHQTMESGNNSILQFAKIKISTNCCFLAQIKLLQGAANAYTIERDAKFSKWFDSILIMDEREAHELSCQVAFHFESVFFISIFQLLVYQFSNSLFIYLSNFFGN